MDQLPEIISPIYIVSKGRFDNQKTANIFLKHGISFKIVVEPSEYYKYCEKIPSKYVLKLPFENLGLGSFPARNFCFEHSKSNGHLWHYIFDDNIQSFAKFSGGKRFYNWNPKEALVSLEQFAFKYKNLAIAGFNYSGFITKETRKAFILNTHVYSGMLINNKIPFRWRLKYNEDVDLCLQALNKKWCTVLLNVYSIDKTSTSVKMKGGNQDVLYKRNDPKKKNLKAKSLEKIWPQYVKTTVRFGRPHHFVAWNKFFKHPLLRYKTNSNLEQNGPMS